MNKYNIDFSKIAVGVLSQQKFETKINEYKVFYKAHLKNVKNRLIILPQLSDLYIRFQKETIINPLIPNKQVEILKTLAEKLLKEHFEKEVLLLFNKTIPTPKSKRSYSDDDNSIWVSLLMGLSQSFETISEQNKLEWSYKTNYLVFLYNCLFNYGLHPDILKRKPELFKRYNFILEHNFKSQRIKQTECKTLLTPDTFQNEILTPYEKKLPIRANGKLIPFKSIYSIKITTTLLKDDEIELFAVKHKFAWSATYTDEISFSNSCVNETDDLLKNPYLLELSAQRFRNQNIYFVDLKRIEQLKKIKTKNFDLIKLVQLCEELNNASSTDNFISSSLLIRAIIDHIPPVFNFKNFTEFANNYSGGTQSFKKLMLNLNNSLRMIADNNIHSQVRQKEVLPTKAQIDFSPELDSLLSEVVRILK